MPNVSDGPTLYLKFGNPARKAELVKAAAAEGVPVVHFVYECFLAWQEKKRAEFMGPPEPRRRLR